VRAVTRGLLPIIAVLYPLLAAADPPSLSPPERHAVEVGVRQFALAVANDVTTHGPTAWRAHFSDTPDFFMAVNGAMAFPDSASATRGIAALPQLIARITLEWGDDLRIDPLTPELAVFASSYTEEQVTPKGEHVKDHGYFTAVAERRHGQWSFRDAHWSSAPMPAAAR
jgi:DNA-binding transcriptional LysR family regulator